MTFQNHWNDTTKKQDAQDAMEAKDNVSATIHRKILIDYASSNKANLLQNRKLAINCYLKHSRMQNHQSAAENCYYTTLAKNIIKKNAATATTVEKPTE